METMEQRKHQVLCLPSLEMEARLIPNEDDPNCGYANGYVGVQKGHPLYGVHYREFDYEIIVHGGVTFSGHIKSPTDDENDPNWLDEDYWWIGFDTKHMGDKRVTENYEYCLEQVVSLACQISSLTKNKYKLVPIGKETDRIINLEWEVQKLTEIKDKFKATVKQLKSKLAHRQTEISTVGYEFYKFFMTFKDELYKNHERDLQDPANKFDDFMEFPVYCFGAFTTSYLEYKDKNI